MKQLKCIVLVLLSVCTIFPSFALDDVLSKSSRRQTILLNGNDWDLYFGHQNANSPQSPFELKDSDYKKIKATVPGNVEIELEREGLIDDITFGMNVYQLRDFEDYQWWYHRSFKTPEVKKGETVELCFDGIDCFADIWLNGKKIASVDNMLVEHNYDVTSMLVDGDNELYVCIKSTELEGRKCIINNLGPRSTLRSMLPNVRKAPHMFGWDIMPRALSAGLWRDVKLEVIPATHFQGIYWRTKSVSTKGNKGKGNANVLLDWQFMTDKANIDNWFFEVELSKDGKSVYNQCSPLLMTCGTETLRLNNIDLWWPRGWGEASLYDASVRVLDENHHVVAENVQKVGFRTIKLINDQLNTPEHKGKFRFIVNGQPIFIKGTNWVPLDALHSRDLKHIPGAVGMMADLNCNMVRCWGGNVYENNLFYELCDKNGIFVWQDFSFACAVYPQNTDFLDKVYDEAQRVVLRLRNHPCIALWAGGNETDIAYSWGNVEFINPNTDLLTRQVLPLVIREWDPHRIYLPSSPFVSEEAFNVNHEVVKTVMAESHLWGNSTALRGHYKGNTRYTENTIDFASEIGIQGCPSKESLIRMMGEENIYPWNSKPKNGKFDWKKIWYTKSCVNHPKSTKSMKRNNFIANQIKCMFGTVPENIDDFILASQLVQAEGKKYFIEFWRMNKGDRNGIMWWNLRDGWPIISDAVVDYYNNKKMAYGFIKKVQKDVCVMIGDAVNGQHTITAVNDTRMPKSVSYLVKNADTKAVLAEGKGDIDENGKLVLGSIPEAHQHEMWLIEYTVDGETFQNHYLEYKAPLKLSDYKRWLKYVK